ncbi:hypothetical protein D6827_01310, partial [Candidatus Parcubacteria bacterium]
MFFKDSVYHKLIAWFVYLTVFLVPVAYFPWTSDYLEINKQTVLMFGVIPAVLLWFVYLIGQDRIRFKFGTPVFLVIFYLIAVCFSALFSLSFYDSWIGQSGQEYMSFITLLALILFLLLLIQDFFSDDKQKALWFAAFYASAVVGVLALFEIFGYPLLAVNLIGAPSSLALYLSAMAISGCAYFITIGEKNDHFHSYQWNWSFKLSVFLTIISAIIVSFVIDYWVIWVLQILGVFLLLWLGLKFDFFAGNSNFILPMVFLSVSVIFLFISPFQFNVYAGEVAPSYAAGWRIAKDSLIDNSLLFGSGPGTFAFDYAKYKSPSVNDSNLWDVIFDRANSHITTMLATYGIVPTIFYLLFAVSILFLTLKYLSRIKHQQVIIYTLPAWLMLFAGQFIYSANFTLNFLFWFFSAVLLSQLSQSFKEYNLRADKKMNMGIVFGLVISSVAVLTLFFVSISRYSAEIAFARALSSQENGANLDNVIADLEKAARLNKLSDVYARNLANAYLLKSADLLNAEASPEYISGFVAAGIGEINRAVNLSPERLANRALAGDIYRELSPLIDGAEDFAIEHYKKAVELAPSNPKYYVLLARAYLNKANVLSVIVDSGGDNDGLIIAQVEDLISEAHSLLDQALELKEDYSPAH